MTGPTENRLLPSLDSPAELRELQPTQLPQVADELREFLIETLSLKGGHFAAGLGTVELTIALHYVFDTPTDRLIWDVGHQAYPHKVLTGRRDRLHSIRQHDGLAPFPKRSESEYDTFGVGHSSTSVSAALGMAIAAAKSDGSRPDGSRRVVAVIGDGALTAGLAYEALSHAGSLDVDLTIILNDNDMSISENVGGMSNYLAKMLSGRLYAGLREGGKKVLQHMPTVWELARRSEEHVKGMVLPGTLFEELGLNYIGPIDGHDLPTLVRTLRNVRSLRGPQFLHVVTRKGKGYAPAEADPIAWHGPAGFDQRTGELRSGTKSGPTYSEVFGEWLCDAATADERVVVITPAMREGSGLVEFEQRFPSRYFDVGIAEQHAVTLAGGMACDGLKPVVAIYSTFLQRGYDQLIHDIALQDLPVLFAIDRGGLVGGDGATHAGAYDLSFLRCVPNMVIMAPSDEAECRAMLQTGLELEHPCAVRYPRGTGIGAAVPADLPTVEFGRGVIRRQGSELALVAFGAMVATALEVAETLDATVLDMRFVKPLDVDLLLQTAAGHQRLVTLEDNVTLGGAGSAVLEALAAAGVLRPVLNLGIPDAVTAHGSRGEVLAEAGLDARSVAATVAAWCAGGQDAAGRMLSSSPR
jgi:1-deoxy-D-xylulose-5-phosphate synthase